MLFNWLFQIIFLKKVRLFKHPSRILGIKEQTIYDFIELLSWIIKNQDDKMFGRPNILRTLFFNTP